MQRFVVLFGFPVTQRPIQRHGGSVHDRLRAVWVVIVGIGLSREPFPRQLGGDRKFFFGHRIRQVQHIEWCRVFTFDPEGSWNVLGFSAASVSTAGWRWRGGFCAFGCGFRFGRRDAGRHFLHLHGGLLRAVDDGAPLPAIEWIQTGGQPAMLLLVVGGIFER